MATMKELMRQKPTDGIRVLGNQMMTKDSGELTCRSAKSSLSGHSLGGSGAGRGDVELTAVDQIVNINRKLVVQIETLRLKVDVDKRQHERATSNVKADTDRKVKVRDLEIEGLRTNLKKKEDAVKSLSTENQKKGAEIITLQQHIDELKEDMRQSKVYVDDIQKQLDELQKEKESLEDGSAYKEKDEKISRLQTEVIQLKENLDILGQELVQAKEKISQQGGKLRGAEVDRHAMQQKMKDELAKVSLTVRHEIEVTREVMQKQWREIKELREQNEGMRNDIREIKELLTADVMQAESNPIEHHYAYQSHNPYTKQTPSPSLPSISKNVRRSVRKK